MSARPDEPRIEIRSYPRGIPLHVKRLLRGAAAAVLPSTDALAPPAWLLGERYG